VRFQSLINLLTPLTLSHRAGVCSAVTRWGTRATSTSPSSVSILLNDDLYMLPRHGHLVLIDATAHGRFMSGEPLIHALHTTSMSLATAVRPCRTLFAARFSFVFVVKVTTYGQIVLCDDPLLDRYGESPDSRSGLP